MAQQKIGKRKSPDTRPARARYWQKRQLEKHKVRQLMRHNGFTDRAKAVRFWREGRSSRYKPAL
jgi:hypothetical protein